MQNQRSFVLNYEVNLPEISDQINGVDIWLPFPRTTSNQSIQSINVSTSMQYEIYYDATYGNAIMYAHFDCSKIKSTDIIISTTATRQEWLVNCGSRPTINNRNSRSLFLPQLSENRKIRFSEEVIEIASSLKKDKQHPIELGLAVYDHVIDNMDYDKTVKGWGGGDAGFACSIGKGNCTDFHSLFIAIARACDLPAQFEIGVAFPTGMTEGDITNFKCGYHCWASFFVQGIGWIPVDCSEAAQNPEKRDYYFGAVDENRFLLSCGRDIQITKNKDSELENFFTEPRVTSDSGRAIYYEKKVSFSDI